MRGLGSLWSHINRRVKRGSPRCKVLLYICEYSGAHWVVPVGFLQGRKKESGVTPQRRERDRTGPTGLGIVEIYNALSAPSSASAAMERYIIHHLSNVSHSFILCALSENRPAGQRVSGFHFSAHTRNSLLGRVHNRLSFRVSSYT